MACENVKLQGVAPIVGGNQSRGRTRVCLHRHSAELQVALQIGFCREGSFFPEVARGGEGFKMESEAHGWGATRATDEDADAVAFAASTASGGQDVLHGAGGHNGPGDPARSGDAVSPAVPGGVSNG